MSSQVSCGTGSDLVTTFGLSIADVCCNSSHTGITVGFVVVPQGMSYALIAKLPPEYGLYTSFMGFLIYWLFATSKDITIGTVAVASTIVGNVILRDYALEIAVLFVGVNSRVGGLKEFCAVAAVALAMDCFMTFILYTAVLTIMVEVGT